VAYKFKAGRDVGDELRRIAHEQARSALDALGNEAGSDRIHEARKRVKKLRALLRLGRSALGPGYAAENAALRDAGRVLSPMRDADVLVKAAAQLRPCVEDRVRPALSSLVGTLARERRAATRDSGEAVACATSALSAFVARAERWRLRGFEPDDLLEAFGRTYREGRHGLAHAARSRDDEQLHEWRKRVKDLRHQLQLLRVLWPAALEAWAQEAHTLGDRLGADHDLAVLAIRVRRTGAGSRARPLEAAIAERRTTLQKKALELGARLFAERRRHVRRRLQAYSELAFG
jgi:CHAD domain-containing protein